jgi:hypothetical protein
MNAMGNQVMSTASRIGDIELLRLAGMTAAQRWTASA